MFLSDTSESVWEKVCQFTKSRGFTICISVDKRVSPTLLVTDSHHHLRQEFLSNSVCVFASVIQVDREALWIRSFVTARNWIPFIDAQCISDCRESAFSLYISCLIVLWAITFSAAIFSVAFWDFVPNSLMTWFSRFVINGQLKERKLSQNKKRERDHDKSSLIDDQRRRRELLFKNKKKSGKRGKLKDALHLPLPFIQRMNVSFLDFDVTSEIERMRARSQAFRESSALSLWVKGSDVTYCRFLLRSLNRHPFLKDTM